MVALLAPVDAEPQQRTAAGCGWTQRGGRNPERGEHVRRVVADLVRVRRHRCRQPVGRAPLGGRDRVETGQRAAVEQRLGHVAAEPAGQVVVAGARPAQRGRAGVLAQRADRFGRRGPGQRLEDVGHLLGREPVVAVPPGLLADDQSGRPQPVQLAHSSPAGTPPPRSRAGWPAGPARRPAPGAPEPGSDRRTAMPPPRYQGRHHSRPHRATGTLPPGWKCRAGTVEA